MCNSANKWCVKIIYCFLSMFGWTFSVIIMAETLIFTGLYRVNEMQHRGRRTYMIKLQIQIAYFFWFH